MGGSGDSHDGSPYQPATTFPRSETDGIISRGSDRDPKLWKDPFFRARAFSRPTFPYENKPLSNDNHVASTIAHL